jgi:rhodanese-related sulfurtransferase
VLSHNSARSAVKLGYNNVAVFSAGYPAWVKEYGAGTSAVAAKSSKGEGTIAVAAFEKILKEDPNSVHLIDVRAAKEFDTGHMKTAANIPVNELEKKVKSLPVDKPIVFVCSTGARSGEAFYMLQDLRPELKKVSYVDAEIAFNKDGTYKITTKP